MAKQAWLKLTDEQITADSLTTHLAERAAKTAEAHGALPAHYLSFGGAASATETAALPAILQHQLDQLTAVSSPETESVLVPSPATQLPVIGRLWGLIRAQVHELILFYVNRLAGQNVRWQGHAEATISELARLVKAQQEEIALLKEQLKKQLKAQDDA